MHLMHYIIQLFEGMSYIYGSITNIKNILRSLISAMAQVRKSSFLMLKQI